MTNVLKEHTLPKQKKKFKARINYEETIGFMIKNPVKGLDGAYIATREGINNSLDAGASVIKITFSQFENQPAMFISDNGEGFDHEGIISAMSYAFSSRDRFDIKTIGVNGTGLKSFLGLGNLNKTKLTILSIHKDTHGCTKMEITFDYLVNLAKKKIANADDYVKTVAVPDDWSENIDRATGTTVILTGYDGRKLKTPNQMITQLGEYITPRACRFVQVQNGTSWHNVAPAVFTGKFYDFDFQTESLGQVYFELFYGGAGEGPIVCGVINAIVPLTELYSKMSKEQKGRISRVWKSISGHIYMQMANTFRLHDGSFSDEFYHSKACDEFLDILVAVSDDLESLAEEAKNENLFKIRKKLIDEMVKIGKELSPPSSTSTNGMVLDKPRNLLLNDCEQDYYILPKGLRMYPNETLQITLNNRGQRGVDFSTTRWQTNDASIVSLINNRGQSATVKANKIGMATITVSGEFGDHVINIQVTTASTLPFINGPKYIKPGDVYLYDLKRYSRGDVIWDIENNPKEEVILIPDMDNKKSVSIKVEAGCRDCEFTLNTRNKSNKNLIAKKNIFVLEDGIKKPASIIKIGKKDYLLRIGVFFPETVAQVDYLFNDSEIPEIVINPLHPRIKDLSYFRSADHILAAVANAAIIDQVGEGTIKALEASQTVEKFVLVMKEKLFEKKE